VRKAISAILAVIVITFLPATLGAQAPERDGQLHKGDLSFELGAGFGAHGPGFGYGIAVLPGVDWILADWELADVLPLAVGIGAKGCAEYIPGTGLGLGLDALASVHLGFIGRDAAEFLQNLDVYAAFGAGVVFLGEANVSFGMVIPAIYAGAAWYFEENLAVYLEGVYRNGLKAAGYGGAVIGFRLKRTPG